MAKRKRTYRQSGNAPWFPFRMAASERQSMDPALLSDRIIQETERALASVNGNEEEEEVKEGLNYDREIVDPSSSSRRAPDKVQEKGGDQETKAEGGEEEEGGDERIGAFQGINEKSEDENGHDSWGDEFGRNQQCRTQPGTSRECSQSERGTEISNEKNDYETAMGRLRAWLGRAGLGKYWALFELHDVDDEVLPFLTVEDLRDMGVTAVGPRWRIHCFIKELCESYS